ncbi:MAG: hypothetical protein R3D99_00920 [Altererythrobacter sp.]
MREIIIGTVAVAAVGLGIFFFPSSEPGKIYPFTMKQAVRKLEKPESTLKQLDLAGYRTYSTIGGPGLVEFIDKANGQDVVCEAQFDREGEGVTVEISCPGIPDDTPLAEARRVVAELTLMEFTDATMSDRPLDQARVKQGFALLDFGGLSQEQVKALEVQSRVGKTPVDIGAQNRQDARDLYANQYNSEGDSSWSTDAVFNGVED